MKKIIVACFAALLLVFGGVSSAQADEYLRVGMEAAYAPFNWTQDDNSNGAVPIEGTKQYANGYDVQIAKKIAEAQGAVGFTVDRIEDIDAVVAEAVKLNKEGKTVVIDARITQHRPLPVEVLELDPKQHSEEAIKAFKEKYEAEELVPFRLFLEEEGLQSRAIK